MPADLAPIFHRSTMVRRSVESCRLNSLVPPFLVRADALPCVGMADRSPHWVVAGHSAAVRLEQLVREQRYDTGHDVHMRLGIASHAQVP
jgi:hypothetical protein